MTPQKIMEERQAWSAANTDLIDDVHLAVASVAFVRDLRLTTVIIAPPGRREDGTEHGIIWGLELKFNIEGVKGTHIEDIPDPLDKHVAYKKVSYRTVRERTRAGLIS
jgi:hypothetical protein